MKKYFNVEMNEKGFTLAELLIVIAILAILITMLVPQFVDLFKQSKSSVLVTEAQSMMKQAQQQWLLSSGKNKVFSSKNSNALSLDNNTGEFNYCIELDANGYFQTVIISNNEYAAYWKADTSSSSKGIMMANLSSNDLKDANDSDEEAYYIYLDKLAESTTGITSCTTSITVPTGGASFNGTVR